MKIVLIYRNEEVKCLSFELHRLILFFVMKQGGVPSSTIKDMLPPSSQQIHFLKKQVLKDAYDQQHLQKVLRPRVNPERKQDIFSSESLGSLRSSRSVQLLPNYRTQPDQSTANILGDSYQQGNFQRQRQSEKQLLRNQRDSLNDLYKPQAGNSQYGRLKKEQEEYAKVLQNQVKQKQLRKMLQKQEERREVNNLEIKRQQRNMGPIQKERSFKQYFNKVSQYRDNVANDYLMYLKQSPRKGINKINDDRQMMEQHRRALQAHNRQERRRNDLRKQELKQVLEQQIMDNRSYKASEMQQYKNRGYVHSQMNMYNPISNPIDYQLDRDNKYVIREIMQKQLEVSRVRP